MDISTLNETESKALAYEQIKLLQATQQNIMVVEQHIAQLQQLRQQQQPKEGE
jgi:hypothetical protein